jgi:hypothetical protein
VKRTLKWIKRIVIYPIAGLIVIFFIAYAISCLVTKPSNDRDWNPDQAVLPYAEIDNNLVTVHNIRNFTYASTTSFTPAYYDKTIDLTTLTAVWYVVEPFSGIPGSAHTFLSFEYGDPSSTSLGTSQYVSISVEIRKEKGESFHPIKGLFNKYELMYVIADERDVIKLRTNYRKDEVFLYPVQTTKEKTRALFLDMIARTNKLKDHPEFYNSIWNTCTTNIVHHVNTITPHRVPLLNLRILLPATSDELAYKLGLIPHDLPFEEVRAKYHINERALRYAQDPDFSNKIRN